jgi:GntR family transcriptional regulator/MocR family aminotransferase
MALPEKLLNEYMKDKDLYNQTTSKIEQLALSKYISEGKLEKHLRKARRYYNSKIEIMQNALNKYNVKSSFNETAMYFEVYLNIANPIKVCQNNGIDIMSTSVDNKIRLSFAQIDDSLIENGIKRLLNLAKK